MTYAQYFLEATYLIASCLFVLALLAIVNMRGTKESATTFMVPTTLFIGSLLAAVVVGVWHTFKAGGHPTPAAPLPPALPPVVSYLSYWLLLKAFSNGCAALCHAPSLSVT